jgi:hypothetical protein
MPSQLMSTQNSIIFVFTPSASSDTFSFTFIPLGSYPRGHAALYTRHTTSPSAKCPDLPKASVFLNQKIFNYKEVL